MATRALVTGISGQDGSYLAELLLAEGTEVHGIVRRGGRPENLEAVRGRVTLIEGDLLDPASLREALRVARPHEVSSRGRPSSPHRGRTRR